MFTQLYETTRKKKSKENSRLVGTESHKHLVSVYYPNSRQFVWYFSDMLQRGGLWCESWTRCWYTWRLPTISRRGGGAAEDDRSGVQPTYSGFMWTFFLWSAIQLLYNRKVNGRSSPGWIILSDPSLLPLQLISCRDPRQYFLTSRASFATLRRFCPDLKNGEDPTPSLTTVPTSHCVCPSCWTPSSGITYWPGTHWRYMWTRSQRRAHTYAQRPWPNLWHHVSMSFVCFRAIVETLKRSHGSQLLRPFVTVMATRN